MSSPQSKARVISLMRPLKDVTVTAGETATFECELSYEGIAVEWFLGGTKLEPSDRVSPDFAAFDFLLGLLSSGLCGLPASACCLIRSCWWNVQDSSRGFDPSFEITRLLPCKRFSGVIFISCRRVWGPGRWQQQMFDNLKNT